MIIIWSGESDKSPARKANFVAFEWRSHRRKAGMLRLRGLAVIAVLIAVSASAQEAAVVCRARSVNVEHGNNAEAMEADAGAASLCLYQGPATIRLEAHKTTIAAILSAMVQSYKISYRSSVELSELRSGTYAGPVRSVLSEVLAGYNYAILYQSSHLEIIIFGKSGWLPVPAAAASEANQTRAAATDANETRGSHPVSRNH